MARSNRLQRQRKIDGYAVAAIAPVLALLPAWLIAVAAFWWAIAQFYYVPFAVFATLWFFAGGSLFVRPIQRLVLQRLLGARSPTRAERDTLQRSWQIVAQANHIPPGKFVLAVLESCYRMLLSPQLMFSLLVQHSVQWLVKHSPDS